MWSNILVLVRSLAAVELAGICLLSLEVNHGAGGGALSKNRGLDPNAGKFTI